MCDLNNFEPGEYSGLDKDKFREWAEKARTFSDSRRAGTRTFMEWADTQSDVITEH